MPYHLHSDHDIPMGYTHYIKPTRILTDDEWDSFTKHVRRIFKTTCVQLASWDGTGKPEVSDEQVAFNGVAPDEDYESCILKRDATGFSFCKTRGDRPYDPVVGAVFLAFQFQHRGTIVSSDGDMKGEDWHAAHDLFETTRPTNRTA